MGKQYTLLSISPMISIWRGRSFHIRACDHFSSASGRTVWLVYATVLVQSLMSEFELLTKVQCKHAERPQMKEGCAARTSVKNILLNIKHKHLVVTSQASSHPSPSSSISNRISSGIASVGWVSFSCTATLLGNSDHCHDPFPSLLSLNLNMMSCNWSQD